jgi:NADPH:quinone reductase-like Zn-dependent oxidoreductase
VYETYGSPDVVKIVELPLPEPGNNEILVKIIATTVNRNDCGFRKPEYPWIIRPIHGFFKPRIRILGTEFSGIVEKCGLNVNSVQVGDEIFGLTGNRFGCHAEYMTIGENGAFTLKPRELTHEEAVSLLDGPWLAEEIVNSFHPQKTKRILVYGASGSIGSACVELAKARGLHVTAVTQEKHFAKVKTLGADANYLVEDDQWKASTQIYDGIVDSVGKLRFNAFRKNLSSTGRWVSTDFGPGNEILWLSIRSLFWSSQKVGMAIPKLKKETIQLFKAMSERKELAPLVDSVFSFDKICDAYRYVEKESKFGSVVIRIADL